MRESILKIFARFLIQQNLLKTEWLLTLLYVQINYFTSASVEFKNWQ